MTEKPTRAVFNPDKNDFDYIDLTPEELAEQASRAITPDPIREEMEAKAAQIAGIAVALDNIPTAEEISSAKSIAELSKIVTRQQALIDALIKHTGMG